MTNKLVYVTALLATAGLAACSAPSTTIIDESGERVTLNAEQTIQAYDWRLIAVQKADGSNEPAPTAAAKNTLGLSFLDNRVLLKNLCNTMNAGYKITGNTIEFTGAAGTLMACEPELMNYERQVAQQLPTAKSWYLAAPSNAEAANSPDPVLTLGFENGDKWRFAGTQTNETKYGSQPELVFLEISNQTQACTISEQNCLKVREVYYDQNSIRSGVGEWVLFQPTAIEGFEQTSDLNQIIRTKRYTIKNAPEGSANHAYVLDMVVQSSRAN